MGGIFNINNSIYYYIISAFIGVFNSVITPITILIMSNWFPKKNRGFLVGLWSSNGNVGNIIADLVGSGLESIFGKENWGKMMVVAASLVITTSFLNFFLLKPEPEKLGIVIDEETAEEQFIRVLSEQI